MMWVTAIPRLLTVLPAAADVFPRRMVAAAVAKPGLLRLLSPRGWLSLGSLLFWGCGARGGPPWDNDGGGDAGRDAMPDGIAGCIGAIKVYRPADPRGQCQEWQYQCKPCNFPGVQPTEEELLSSPDACEIKITKFARCVQDRR